MLKKNLALMFIFLFLFVPVFAQSNSSKQSQQSTNTTAKALTTINLDVQVVNKKTSIIVDNLKENNFEIYEDNIKQTITSFSQNKTPLSVLLLIDASSKVDSILPLIKNGTASALQMLKAEDEVGVMLFATSTATLKSFSKDKTTIANTIDKTKLKAINFGKAKYLSEALHDAALHMKQFSNPNYQKVVIVITDNIIDKLPDGYTTKETVNKLLEVGVTVSAIKVNPLKTQAFIENHQTQNSKDKLFQPVSFQSNNTSKAGTAINNKQVSKPTYSPTIEPTKESVDRNSTGTTVETYAKETGGEVIDARDDSFSNKCGELIQHLRSRYNITYNSSNTKNNSKLRKLSVKVVPSDQNLGLTQDDLEIKSKKGFFPEVPEETNSSSQKTD
jgi:VWFA-related protein